MTCEQLLKSLTDPQRRAFEKLSKGRVVAPRGANARRPYENLIKTGLAQSDRCALGLTFTLTMLGRICEGPVVCTPV